MREGTKVWNLYYRQQVTSRNRRYEPTHVTVTSGVDRTVASKATVAVLDCGDRLYAAATACLNPIDGEAKGRSHKDINTIGKTIATGRLNSDKHQNLLIEGDEDSGFSILMVEGNVSSPPNTVFTTLNNAILWNIGARRVTNFTALEGIALD